MAIGHGSCYRNAVVFKSPAAKVVRAEPFQGVPERGVGVCARQDRLNVGEGLLGAHSAVSGCVAGGDGRCPGFGLDTVHEDLVALGAERRVGVRGLGEHEVEVGVAGRAGAVDQPHLDVVFRPHAAGWDLGCAESAQRYHCADAGWQVTDGAGPAEQDAGISGWAASIEMPP